MPARSKEITSLWKEPENKNIDHLIGQIEQTDSIQKSGKMSEATQDPQTFDRDEALKIVPAQTIRKGWFTLAHLILEPGSTVVDMGCSDGALTYVMAAFSPQVKFIGVDRTKRIITKARQTFKLPNLEYRVGDITKDIFDEGSVDAIINSYILHEIYSHSRFNERSVRQTMRNHAAMLKPGGLMFIHDFARPPPEEFVMLEMPVGEEEAEDFKQMSEADLLVWYSEHARPNTTDPECCGFYMEELPPRFPRTRLFRLPYKWAYEFIMRKDDRELWESELPKEYTFFTKREFRKELRALGTRVLYSAPYWDDSYIKKHFDGHFRLYKDDGTPLGSPPTSFIAVAQKVGEGKSLVLEERRPSRESHSDLRIFSMRNEYDGSIIDIVTRDYDATDVVPYRINEHGGLNVFLHEGIPRGIINAVPRHGQSLDGKRWSGHMIEALSVDSVYIREAEENGYKGIVKFSASSFGLRPSIGCAFEDGPSFYPAPDHIDERVETRYLRIESGSGKPLDLRDVARDAQGFTSPGRIREVSAQSILNAISVGLIPNSRLETQILALYQHLGMKAETWRESPLTIPTENPDNVASMRDLLSKMSEDDTRYRESKGTAGQLRIMNSIFVDEGYANGGPSGLAAKGLDFMVEEDGTVNKAVILPLTKNVEGDLLAGITSEYMPVPQRYKGNGLILSTPSIVLPREIENMEMAKRYIAEKLGTTPDNVARLGESFFYHSGLTPQRIYPFAATRVDIGQFQKNGFVNGTTSYTPMKYVWMLNYWDCDDPIMAVFNRAYQAFFHETEMTINLQHKFFYQQRSGLPRSLRAEEIFSNKGADSAEIREALTQGAHDEFTDRLTKALNKSKTVQDFNQQEFSDDDDSAGGAEDNPVLDDELIYGQDDENPKLTHE